MRSERYGCMCHLLPLSTTKPTLRCPLRRWRLCLAAFRRALDASLTRAGVDGGAESTRARGACGTAVADGVAGAQPWARGEPLAKSERSAAGA
eukprot:2496326-Pleurochrysis_carterae.AAC.1